ncbi:MAG: PEP-utilizing enzyme [Actinoallomurus sp.]
MTDDPLHLTVTRERYWTTNNTEEAHPGVLTPLGWTVAGAGIETALRRSLHAIGALTASEAAIPKEPEERAFGVFGGRFGARLDFFIAVGNRIPGTSGPAFSEQVFSFVPPDAPADRVRRRYPAIATRLPTQFLLAPRRARRLRADTAAWWVNEVARTPTLDLPAARAQFASANARFQATGIADGIALMAAIQPIYEQLERLADRAGVPSGPLMSGHGAHEESELVADIWACARGRMPTSDVLRRFGFHGPRTGELSSRSWREDPTPFETVLAHYRTMPDDSDPAIAEHERARRRRAAELDLLAALPAARRPGARALLRLAASYLPLRGKAGRTQSLDVMRAAARRIGEHLPLEDADDIFMLTADELTGELPPDLKGTVAARRERYAHYCRLELPRLWAGNPELTPIATAAASGASKWEGVPASPGVAEGVARVVADPAMIDLEPGEILIAHTTDPSWASLMFLASALIVDVGGLLSHAAITARELGVPCVMDLRNATTEIQTGDRIRVDGTNGTVELLTRRRPEVRGL